MIPSRFRAISVVAIIAVPSFSSDYAEAVDWDQWLGPDRNLISSETNWRAKWSSKEPKRLWGANVGIGYSSVAVSEGRLYTLGHRKGNETVYCFDAESGREVWKHTYRAQLVDYLHDGGPAATPTVDGKRLYTVSREGHVFCFDKANGEIAWQLHLQKMLGVRLPEWGFSSSPLIDGERLLLDAGPFVAFNKNTGKLIWKTKEYRCGYGSPTLFTEGGKKFVSVLNNDALIVARPEDGTVLGEFSWRTQYATSATTPIADSGTLFISTAYNKGCALLEAKNGKLRALYENKNMRNHMNNCVLYKGKLYGFDRQATPRRLAHLVCMDHKSGKVHWKESGFGSGGLMAADGKLIILGDQGELVIAEATPAAFKAISRKQVLKKGTTWTVPVLSNGLIYCRNARGDLVCLDVRES